ncbi:uncharacterized protein il12rb1 isoform 2-T2 [Aulostomus maculatus]
MCEWSMNTTENHVIFDFYMNDRKIETNIKETWVEVSEERLFQNQSKDIWIKAHLENSSCSSPRRSGELRQTVKYRAPQNISGSWSENNLYLTWNAFNGSLAFAEVLFRKQGHSTESWEKRLDTANFTHKENLMHQFIVGGLMKDSAYQVKIRHQSKKAPKPLWSEWSPVVTVPAALEHPPEVKMTKKSGEGVRRLTLTWKLEQQTAAFGSVTYILKDTQSSRGCPCKKKEHHTKTTTHTIYVSYSAVNISVIARNEVGYSSPAIIQLPAEPAANLKPCSETLLDKKWSRKTCLQLYELRDEDQRPENVITLMARIKKKERERIRTDIKDYVRYLYFEHSCESGKPKTVHACLFYQKEGAPQREPPDFIAFGETQISAAVSWRAIPVADQRSVLTHYNLCVVKISSQDEQRECFNMSASLREFHLENLTPGTKYNISMAGVTRMGEGPRAFQTINTMPEKSLRVWFILGSLLGLLLISGTGMCIFKRIRPKILPAVPTPVISDFTTHPAETQEMLQKDEEELHDVMLHQLYPQNKSLPEATEEATVLPGEWDDCSDEGVEKERVDSEGSGEQRSSPASTKQASREEEIQLEQELALLLYRRGLVLDLKMD